MSDTSSNSSVDRWSDINVDLDALHKIVCEVFREPPSQCGPPVAISEASYGWVYSFELPTQKVVARLVYPLKPLFKTESEVAAMDFVRSRTSLPVPKVFSYCSEANNPVGVEWLIMEHMPGVEMCDALDDLGVAQKRRLALELIDLYDQLFRLKANGCGGIYYSVDSVDDHGLHSNHQRTPRWAPLSPESVRLLKTHCNHPIHHEFTLGPINDISIANFDQPVPSPSQTLPVFSSEDYLKLLAFNGIPSTRSECDLPTREVCVELFRRIYNLYPNSTVFGPSADSVNFRFSHGDLHEGNILIDPCSGAITGVIDWEGAGFCPLWKDVKGVGWLEEDRQRLIHEDFDPGNFDEDWDSEEDAELRAFFRVEMNKRNPDVFEALLGAVELRAVLDAAVDIPPPEGKMDVFLNRYHELGCWNEDRQGSLQLSGEMIQKGSRTPLSRVFLRTSP